MTITLLAFYLAVAAASDLPAWDFAAPEQGAVWAPNAHVEVERAGAEGLYLRTTDWDPFLHCREMDFEATPWQYVVVTIRGGKSGEGELFWSGSLEGQYSGLSQVKSARFTIPGDGAFHEIHIFPGWQGEGRIRQMRLDLFPDAEFVLKSVAVKTWADEDVADSSTAAWDFERENAWFHPEGSRFWWSPPLRLDVDDRPYVSLDAYASEEATGVLYWGTAGLGMHHEEFSLSNLDGPRVYDIEVGSYPSWRSPIVVLGLEMPAAARVRHISINDRPQAPEWMRIDYFGFDNGMSRAGRPERLRAHVTNTGGKSGLVRNIELTLPEGVRLLSGPEPAEATVHAGGYADILWEVQAATPGTRSLQVTADLGESMTFTKGVALDWQPPVDLDPAEYVPAPKPIETTVDVCAYYFPGWGSDASWDPVRATAPVRKPLLGWYDESKVEVVDWQIKWAVENGITCFLVDWYWNQGGQHLTHWFEAYRQARYRDMLDVAIMWANHNPPGSHSLEDWRNVTREWIDRYFNLPSYYRIDGKPAVFIWDPRLIRNDIGADAVKAMYAESQQMARDAGYDGITFIAMHDHESAAQAQTLLDEGYFGATNYHEWGRAPEMAPSKTQITFTDVVATAPETWARRRETVSPLTYYPVVDTGWDARPWHGAKSLVIRNRSPRDFERLLQASRAFVEQHDLPFVVLGPLNEWGEGSYIEPCTEYNFEMYEAVRNVFATGDRATFPANFAPRDVGLGPYDYPPQPAVTSWIFDDDPQGWAPMMNVSQFRVEEGALHFKTDSNDGAIHIATPTLYAEAFTTLVIEMRLDAAQPRESMAQLFFSPGGRATSEAASFRVPVHIDGQWHTYRIDLRSNMRWRGKIARLRFDPCTVRDVTVSIRRIVFEDEPVTPAAGL
jgi:hypothetical protein